MSNKTDYRAEVKALMAAKNINAPKLANQTGISIGTIYKYLQGKQEITTGNLQKIMDVLKAK